MPSATISEPWGQGSETAAGTAEVVLACGVDASGIASQIVETCGGAVDGRLRGQ